MNERQKLIALKALGDIIELIRANKIIEFSCGYNFMEEKFRGVARHTGPTPDLSQGFIRTYGDPE